MSYFQHEATPYPLADHHGDVPNNIIVDMSLTVNDDFATTAKVTALRITNNFAFVAIETAAGALAHVHVVNPIPGRLYRYDNGALGWVIFGPGAATPYEFPIGETLDLDHKCLIIESPDVPEFILVVNGKQYIMPDVLNIEADGIAQLQVTTREGYTDLIPCPDELSSESSSQSSSSLSSTSSLSISDSSDSSALLSSNSSSESSSSSLSSSSSSSSNSSSSSSSSSSESSSSSSSSSSNSSSSESSGTSNSSSSGDSSGSSESSSSSPSSLSSQSDSSISNAPPLFPPEGPSTEYTTIEVTRNDNAIDPSILNGGMTAIPYPPVKSIGGAIPDELGNIDIIIDIDAGLVGSGGVYIIPCVTKPEVSGYVLWTRYLNGCIDDKNLLDQLKYSDWGSGVPYELPFDALLGTLKCDEPPCGPVPPSC